MKQTTYKVTLNGTVPTVITISGFGFLDACMKSGYSESTFLGCTWEIS